MSKLPAFMFYPGDWQKDLDLRRCSHAAKGVWIDMLCLMHESEERGVLRWPERDIAAAIGGNADVTLSVIAELLEKGVAKKRERDGAIYCARMVREESKRLKAAARVQRFRDRNGECNADETGDSENSSVTPLLRIENENENKTIGGNSVESATPKAMAILVLTYFNEKCNSHYRMIPEYLKAIEARLESVDYDVEGVKQMIDRQYALWYGDPVMDKSLNPTTLFRPKNFPGYYDDRSRKVTRKINNGTNLDLEIKKLEDELYYPHDRTPEKMERLAKLKAERAAA